MTEPFKVFTQEKRNHISTQRLVHKSPQQFYLYLSKTINNPNAKQKVTEQTMWYSYTMTYYSAKQKNGLQIQ
jgi:hypothetical protein